MTDDSINNNNGVSPILPQHVNTTTLRHIDLIENGADVVKTIEKQLWTTTMCKDTWETNSINWRRNLNLPVVSGLVVVADGDVVGATLVVITVSCEQIKAG